MCHCLHREEVRVSGVRQSCDTVRICGKRRLVIDHVILTAFPWEWVVSPHLHSWQLLRSHNCAI
jgi:hypothetical protein